MRPPKFPKSDTFYIEYVNSETGESCIQRVQGHKLASQVARKLAIATGHRAVIRREEPDAENAWQVFFVDVQKGTETIVLQVASKEDAAKVFKKWKEMEFGAVCVMWPAWAPPPIISI